MEDSSWNSRVSLLCSGSCPSSDPIAACLFVKLFALPGLRFDATGPSREGLRRDRKEQTSPWHDPDPFGALHRDLATLLEEVFETG